MIQALLYRRLYYTNESQLFISRLCDHRSTVTSVRHIGNKFSRGDPLKLLLSKSNIKNQDLIEIIDRSVVPNTMTFY